LIRCIKTSEKKKVKQNGETRWGDGKISIGLDGKVRRQEAGGNGGED
jgi:hypothetical protein